MARIAQKCVIERFMAELHPSVSFKRATVSLCSPDAGPGRRPPAVPVSRLLSFPSCVVSVSEEML